MVDPKQMGKQMIAYYKTTFDNSFSAMMMFQEQMERLAKLQLALMANVPDEGNKCMSEWCRSYKQNCLDFKKLVDEGFTKLESFFSES
ncbi:MAG: hypothetical protein WAU47_09200 [Desulfobaccales bacterium]